MSSSVSPEALLVALPEPPGPGGEDLRYTPLFDQIRLARREDDPRLTQGVWEQDIKQADWAQVASLTSTALKIQSKDLNLAGWLGEAWIVLHGAEGLAAALSLLTGLFTRHADNLWPRASDDTETHLHCAEWMDRCWAERLVHVPLTLPSAAHAQAMTLAHWMQARHQAAVVRPPSGKPRPPQGPDLGTIRSAITLMPDAALQEADQIWKKVRGLLVQAEEATNARIQPHRHLFMTIRDRLDLLDDMFGHDPRIRPPAPSHDTTGALPPEPAGPGPEAAPASSLPQTPSASGTPGPAREEIYALVAQAVRLLRIHEPHSPVLPLLCTALQWKDMTFPRIMGLLEQTGLNLQHILKLFPADDPTRNPPS
jgi:type VI secretion system protein ImpA